MTAREWMKADINALVISSDRGAVDDICQGFKICLPQVRLMTTSLGTEGVELVDSVSPDIVILDMSVPDITVWDAFLQIRKSSEAPVFLLSYSRDEADIVKSLEMGFDTYITKPFRQLEFMAHVRSTLRRNPVHHSKLQKS
jgi:DNA-binding response OmpR family regulator